jgi:hypothetical protein
MKKGPPRGWPFQEADRLALLAAIAVVLRLPIAVVVAALPPVGSALLRLLTIAASVHSALLAAAILLCHVSLLWI